jgi:hypothetical protein
MRTHFQSCRDSRSDAALPWRAPDLADKLARRICGRLAQAKHAADMRDGRAQLVVSQAGLTQQHLSQKLARLRSAAAALRGRCTAQEALFRAGGCRIKRCTSIVQSRLAHEQAPAAGDTPVLMCVLPACGCMMAQCEPQEEVAARGSKK